MTGSSRALGALAHAASLDIYSEPDRDAHRRTGIICTIGPNTNTPQMLADLRRAGLNVMRMNFSHGDHAYHASVIDNLRKSFAVFPSNTPVAVALDTKGPEVRTGLIAGGGDVLVEAGQTIVMTTDEEWKEKGTKERLFVDYANLVKVIQPGGIIFVDDGLISLKVQQVSGKDITCSVVNGGAIGSRKGINLPEVNVDLPALSEKDKRDLRFGVEQGVDMVFASFIRKAADIAEIRACLGDEGAHIKIISKIENHEGMRNYDEILAVTDGIMVARGDLGIEIPAEKVFLAQKMMIAKANLVGKPVICATQMLESMVKNPRPTRAEVSDVANAVLDGADCVMLSGETAKGKYPIESVRMMSVTCVQAELAQESRAAFEQVRANTVHTNNNVDATTETIAQSAVTAVLHQPAVRAIVTLSRSGNTARLISKYQPNCPILMVTRNQSTSRQALLHRGVLPFWDKDGMNNPKPSWNDDVEARVQFGCSEGKKMGLLKSGDTVVVVQGSRKGVGHTSQIKLVKVE